MGLGPGEAFVVRNIANMVSALDTSAAAAIGFAITHLEVEEVIVCGHYLCGGIEAAMQPGDPGSLDTWVRAIRDLYVMNAEELDSITDDEMRKRRLVELNVRQQCLNLLKLADVQRAHRQRRLRVHGWVFDISQGRLVDVGFDSAAEVEKIARVYRSQG